jgi:hypothetical protein
MHRPKFGVKGYSIQQTDKYDPFYKIPNNIKATYKSKERFNFLDEYTKFTKWVPSANYNITTDWTQNFAGKRGRFMKSKKVTMTEQMMIKGKKNKPGPASYKIKSEFD